MDFRCPELCPFGERLPYLIATEAFVAVYHGCFMENWITQRRRTICSHESWTLGAFFHILLHFQSADFLLARRKCEWDKIMPQGSSRNSDNRNLWPGFDTQKNAATPFCHDCVVGKTFFWHHVHHVMIPEATISHVATTLKSFHKFHLARLRCGVCRGAFQKHSKAALRSAPRGNTRLFYF